MDPSEFRKLYRTPDFIAQAHTDFVELIAPLLDFRGVRFGQKNPNAIGKKLAQILFYFEV
jgi:hypothetical protein